MHTYWLFLILLDPLGLAIQGGSKSIHSEQDSIIMDWSIGQPACFDLINKNYPITISSGFIQNKNCDQCLYKSLDSLEGKLIDRIIVNLSGLRLQYTINLSHYTKGMYFLKYYFLIDQQIPIIKTIQIYKT